MIGFLVWGLTGTVFVGVGLYAFFAQKEVAFGFWANAKAFPVKNVKAYNRAVGKLWIVFGIVFVCLGIPLLKGQNTPFIVISILGTLMEVIVVMVIYTVVIERKYRDDRKEKG